MRARVRPDRPTLHRFADVLGGDPFVVAVIPLLQVGILLDPVTQAGEARRFQRPAQGTAEDHFKLGVFEDRGQKGGLFAAFFRQGDVASARVTSVLRPFRLAMTDEVDLLVRML